jgi:hypothetical protein
MTHHVRLSAHHNVGPACVQACRLAPVLPAPLHGQAAQQHRLAAAHSVGACGLGRLEV